MPLNSRRDFLRTAAALTALPALGATTPLRVQYTTGSHTVPLQQYAMFEDDLFSDLDTTIRPHPNAFAGLNNPGPDVLVLADYLTDGWPESDRPHIQKYLDSGRGLVVLHHSVGTNQAWPWWYEEVTGGVLLQRDLPGKPHAGLKQFPRQKLSPIGDHPIVRGFQPFTLPQDELFYNMLFSPKITPLLRSDDPDLANVQGTVAWLGVHPKARVVCIQPGHTDFVNADPRYRKLVHNMILWAGGRLK